MSPGAPHEETATSKVQEKARELGIPIHSIQDAHGLLSGAIAEAELVEFEKAQQVQARESQRKRAEQQADQFWRHAWRARELTVDPD